MFFVKDNLSNLKKPLSVCKFLLNLVFLGGLFFEPNMLTEVSREMIVATDETFGPVATLFIFQDEEPYIEVYHFITCWTFVRMADC